MSAEDSAAEPGVQTMNQPGKPRPWLRWWWPVLAMMAMIFLGSTDLGAASHQSRFLVPLLQWLGLGEAAIRGIILAIRKTAHLSEYALFVILLWRALGRRPILRQRKPWPLWEAAWPFGVSVLYATLDEIHQAFVPSRTGSAMDVMIDATGAAIGLALLWWWHHRGSAKTRA